MEHTTLRVAEGKQPNPLGPKEARAAMCVKFQSFLLLLLVGFFKFKIRMYVKFQSFYFVSEIT
jgi:hypothetical protein